MSEADSSTSSSPPLQTTNRDFLRHVVATIAYRGGKTIRDAPEDFSTLRIFQSLRTPLEILPHLGDLLSWAATMVGGRQSWRGSPPGTWHQESERFFHSLRRLDDSLEASTGSELPVERLFQGPLADALTHIGQIALLRRVAGSPVKGENYFKADVAAGRVGPQQRDANLEFD